MTGFFCTIWYYLNTKCSFLGGLNNFLPSFLLKSADLGRFYGFMGMLQKLKILWGLRGLKWGCV